MAGWISTGRSRLRCVVALVAWMVVAPTVSVVWLPPSPVDAQYAGPCDADGDGRDDGYRTTWTTNGADPVADLLQEEAGRRYSASAPGYRWEVPVCAENESDGTASVVVTGPAVRVEAAAARSWEYGALVRALADLDAAYPAPTPRMAPAVDGEQVVGLETWLAIDPVTFSERRASATVEEVTVTATAVPIATVWQFSDGEVRCLGPGVEYTAGASGPAPCGREWEHTTRVAPMSMEVRIEYEVTWTSTLASSGSVGDDGPSLGRWDLVVGEIQSVGTVGERDRPANPGLAPEPNRGDFDCSLVALVSGPCSTGGDSADPDYPAWPDAPERDCSIGGIISLSPWDTIGDCVAEGIDWLAEAGRWLAGEALELWMALPGPIRAGVEAIMSALEGCAEFGIEAVQNVWGILQTMWDAGTDPVGFVQEQWDLVNEMRKAISEDPAGFAREFLGELVDEELLRDDPAKWVGKVGCELIASALTGGAGSSARAARLLDKIDEIKLWRDRRGGRDDGADNDADRRRDQDGDADPVTCSLNSFPTGTRVLLADGSRAPIELIRPGDEVLAHDLVSGQWRAQPVLAQWSHTDDGRMATAWLTDGSSVTATDHHRFWVDSQGRWIELDDVGAGDVLLTPDGAATVARVEVAAPAETLVWELDVAIDNNFTVSTGTVDLLVHNADCGTPEHRNDAWDDYDGPLSRAEFDERYDELARLGASLPDDIDVSGVDPVTGLPVVIKDADGRYLDLRSDEMLDQRAAEIFASEGEGSVILGRQDDTDRYLGDPDSVVLAVGDWSVELNDAFIRNVIAERRPVRFVSDPFDLDPSIFEREVQMLAEAGWTITSEGAFPP